MEICRFGSKIGSGYEQVGIEIQNLVEEAREALQKALDEEREGMCSMFF
jgi:hypothetical protein